jgi:putative MFS transporter
VLAAHLAASGAATLLWAVAENTGLVLAAAGPVNFFSLGARAALYAYTPERYPTQLRDSGMGAASGYARIGDMLAPLAGGALLGVSLVAALSVFASVFVLPRSSPASPRRPEAGAWATPSPSCNASPRDRPEPD